MSEFENFAELPSSSPSTEDICSEYFDHIKKINDIFYDQIKISDQKAAYIFTFMLAFLVSSVEVRAVFTWARYAQGTPQAILFSGLLAAASVFSILSAILVVLPRRLDKSTSMFWGHGPDIATPSSRRRSGATSAISSTSMWKMPTFSRTSPAANTAS